MHVKQKCRLVELYDHVQWNKFKDGWPNIFIDDVHDIAGRDGEIDLYSAHSFIFYQGFAATNYQCACCALLLYSRG